MNIKSSRSLFFLAFFFCLSCAKLKEEPIEIDETNLTACPAGANCSYLFSDQADVNEDFTLKSGAYKVFRSDMNSFVRTVAYIKAPMQKNSFKLGKQDILNGKVKLLQGCLSCYSIELRPVDGYVKGINCTQNHTPDQEKWILEANIILEAVSDPSFRDTVYFKQYFYPNSVSY